MASLGVVDWVLLDQRAAKAVQVGDLVSKEPGGMPTYQVMALEDGRAWLSDGQHDRLWLLPLTAFHWKAASI
jgi:hypothetical protein